MDRVRLGLRRCEGFVREWLDDQRNVSTGQGNLDSRFQESSSKTIASSPKRASVLVSAHVQLSLRSAVDEAEREPSACTAVVATCKCPLERPRVRGRRQGMPSGRDLWCGGVPYLLKRGELGGLHILRRLRTSDFCPCGHVRTRNLADRRHWDVSLQGLHCRAL